MFERHNESAGKSAGTETNANNAGIVAFINGLGKESPLTGEELAEFQKVILDRNHGYEHWTVHKLIDFLSAVGVATPGQLIAATKAVHALHDRSLNRETTTSTISFFDGVLEESIAQIKQYGVEKFLADHQP